MAAGLGGKPGGSIFNQDPYRFAGSLSGTPQGKQAFDPRTGMVEYRQSPDYRYNPETGGYGISGQARGREAGEALKALQESSGLPLLGGSWSSGGGAGGPGGAPGPQVQMPDTTAANAAIFARAKDQAGQTAKASLQSLRESLGARGMLGSGAESGATADIIQRAAQGSDEITREQSIQDAGNLASNARAAYQGAIQQRGQDISAQQASAARQQQALQGLLEMVGGRGILY